MDNEGAHDEVEATAAEHHRVSREGRAGHRPVRRRRPRMRCHRRGRGTPDTAAEHQRSGMGAQIQPHGARIRAVGRPARAEMVVEESGWRRRE